MRYALALLCLLLAAPCLGAISEVGSAVGSGSGTAIATAAHGLTINSGDVLIAFIASDTDGNITSDNNSGNEFTLGWGQRFGTVSSQAVSMFYRVSDGSEPATWQFTQTISDRWGVVVRVFRGVHADIWDVHPTCLWFQDGTGTTSEGVSVATFTDGALAISVGFADGAATQSGATAGYGTEIEASGQQGVSTWTQSVATAGTILAEMQTTLSVTNDWDTGTVLLRPDTGTPLAGACVGMSTMATVESGNISVTPPTTATDDIMVLAVAQRDNVDSTYPAGWAVIQEGNNGTGLRFEVAWKRASGAEGAFTITHAAGSACSAVVGVFRGLLSSATPLDTSSISTNASSATVTGATITSTVADALIIWASGKPDDSQEHLEVGTAPAIYAEGCDCRYNGTNDVTATLSYAPRTGAGGATGTVTSTLTTGNELSVGVVVALKPEAGTRTPMTHVMWGH